MQAVALQPVTVAVAASSNVFVYYKSGIISSTSCGSYTNHGVTIVGYGNDATLKMDYWLVKNSWGTWWGESGYFRVLRTNSTSSSGICAILTNPNYPVL